MSEVEALRARVVALLGEAALLELLAGALDRKQLERLAGKPQAGSPSVDKLSREELTSHVMVALLASPAGAEQVVHELDRASETERALLASMSSSEIEEQWSALTALRGRHHAGKLKWALARDARSEVTGLATRLGQPTEKAPPRLDAVAPAVAPPPRDAAAPAVDGKLRRAEKRVAAVERELSEARSRAARVDALEEEAGRLRQTIESLRELLARERTAAQANAVRESPPAAASSAPLVEPPRKAERRDAPRVGVFVDAANLAGAARLLFGRAVDFRKLLPLLVGGRRLSEARIYAIDKGESGFAGFAQAVRQAGYKVLSKKPRQFDDGTVKADWDVGMSVHIMELRGKVDVVVLASGDGDFAPLVSSLKSVGVRVEIAAFTERAAADLLRLADQVVALDTSLLE